MYRHSGKIVGLDKQNMHQLGINCWQINFIQMSLIYLFSKVMK